MAGGRPVIQEELESGHLERGALAVEILDGAAVDDLVGVGEQDQVFRPEPSGDRLDGHVPLEEVPRPGGADVVGEPIQHDVGDLVAKGANSAFRSRKFSGLSRPVKVLVASTMTNSSTQSAISARRIRSMVNSL